MDDKTDQNIKKKTKNKKLGDNFLLIPRVFDH